MLLRVRCNDRGHLPTLSRCTDATRYVGWRLLRAPRYCAANMALNDARAAVGLPVLVQHEIPGGGRRGVSIWYVPKDAVTVLRPAPHHVTYYAKALANGDLVAADDATARVGARYAATERLAAEQASAELGARIHRGLGYT